jgi:MarR family transcriptional regulator, organic hydroperoxide resistance regulator
MDRQRVIEDIANFGQEQSALSTIFREMVAQQLGISASDGECLAFIVESRLVTAGDLARFTGLTTGAITGVIRRLEKAGLAKAERDPTDRRKVVVKPQIERLGQGERLYASYVKASFDRVYSKYSLNELKTIADYHRKMAEVLREEIKKLKGSLSTENPPMKTAVSPSGTKNRA